MAQFSNATGFEKIFDFFAFFKTFKSSLKLTVCMHKVWGIPQKKRRTERSKRSLIKSLKMLKVWQNIKSKQPGDTLNCVCFQTNITKISIPRSI